MERIITVKGVGHVTVKPDLVIVNFGLETMLPNYKRCMNVAAERTERIKAAIIKSGLPKDALKTSNFKMEPEYRSVKASDGGYNHVFSHWECNYDLKVEFPLDAKLLSTLLYNVVESKADCEVDVNFTIADPSRVEKSLLESAAKNARIKAETLCAAMGAKLGDLVNINYNWGRIDVFSHSRFACEDMCPPGAMSKSAMPPEMDPEDIKVNDSATFIWEIEGDGNQNPDSSCSHCCDDNFMRQDEKKGSSTVYDTVK